MNENNCVSFNDFAKLDIRIGEIRFAERVPNTDKLIKLSVDIGEEEPRQIISGIATYFPDEKMLVGKKCAFVVNLEPRVIKGLESRGMLLAVGTPDNNFSLLIPESSVPTGSTVH